MILPLVSVQGQTDCWNQIGVWGDRSCTELLKVGHCHNCPVFAGSSRRFLDGLPPEGYLDEWTKRLIDPIEQTATDLQSVLILRIDDEWLALRVQVLLEVTNPRPIHRMPHRAGLLLGLVNIRGELQLCVQLTQVLGVKHQGERPASSESAAEATNQGKGKERMIVVQRDGDRWVFPVDEVDQVYRFSASELIGAPATLARAAHRLTRGVFSWRERSIGYLDDGRLFQVLRTKIQ
ncbi:MAG: chemotaxis protein CheW [Gemmataceae bacterium]